LIGGIEFTVRLVRRVGFVVEVAVGQGTREALVKEQEQNATFRALAVRR
jgi:hypothetical protein